MKNKLGILIAATLVIAAAAQAGFAAVSGTNDETKDTQAVLRAGTNYEPAGWDENRNLNPADPKIDYVVTVKYPKFTGGLNERAKKTINLAIENYVARIASEFSKETAEAIKNLPDNPPGRMEYFLEIGYDLVRFDEKFVSILFFCTIGGEGTCAHPTTIQSTMNFDSASGKMLYFSDIFKKTQTIWNGFQKYA